VCSLGRVTAFMASPSIPVAIRMPTGKRSSTFNRALARQIEALIELIGRMPDGPLIVLGDLNLPPGSRLHKRLIDACGLIDPFDDTPTIHYRGQGWRLDDISYRGWEPDGLSEALNTFQDRTAPMRSYAAKRPCIGPRRSDTESERPREGLTGLLGARRRRYRSPR